MSGLGSSSRLGGPSTHTVELSIECFNLPNRDFMSKSDPVCVVSQASRQGRWVEVFRTESIKDNLNPAWNRKFELEYKPQDRQIFRFTVFDMDSPSAKLEYHDFLGSIECSLAEIIAEKRNGFSRNLDKSPGRINIFVEELTENKEVVTLSLSARNLDKKDLFGLSDPYLELCRATSAAKTSYVIVHRTEVVKNTLNPDWAEFSVDVRSLCNGDYNRDIRLDVYDWNLDGGQKYMGSFHTNLTNLRKGPGTVNVYDVFNEIKRRKKGRKCKKSGTVTLNSILIEDAPSFSDLISAGTQVNLSCAVDFSESNGDPSNPKSLHYRDPDSKYNQYATAIKAVGSILQDYTKNRSFTGLGFSGRLPPSGDISQEFFLTLNPHMPHCSGVDGLLAAYHFSLSHVQLGGPAHFSPIVNHVARLARANLNNKYAYFILIIITNGLIKDLEATKQAIVAASVLPLSIVIVGVGNEDFTDMIVLDSDDKLLSRGSHVAKRDIVQFVELRKFIQGGQGFSRELLAKEVLAEIPEQITGYMKMRGFKY